MLVSSALTALLLRTDDCCQSDVGAAYQAQGYNYIKQIDPYHAVIGASDCGDTWVFFDSAETCT